MSDHGYTSHGHPLPGKTQHPEHRPQIANCGGPIICKQCRQEVAAAFKEMFQAPAEATEPQPHLSKSARDALKIFEGIAIQEPAPWIEKAAMLAAAGATDQQIRAYVRIISSGVITQDDLNHLEESGIKITFNEGDQP